VTGSALPIFPYPHLTGLDAFAEYARLRAEDPVSAVDLVEGGRAYLATRYEDVKRVFNDPVFSRAAAQRPGSAVLSQAARNPYSLLNMDPPEHTRIRRLLTPAFTGAAVQRLRPRLEWIADGLVDAMLAQGPPVDFVLAFAAPLPALAIAELLGVPAADRDRLLDWLAVFVSTGAATPQQYLAVIEELATYLNQLIASKRGQPAEDLIGVLVAGRDGAARLSEPEVLYTVLLLVAGGYETTAGLLTNSLVMLQRHPDQLALLRDKPELIPDAVEELLRFVPIAWCGMERVALHDVELSGVRVPAGASVIPMMYAANRDPGYLEDPERLDLTRAQPPHLAFGYGVHRCIGAQLARLELQIAFATLLGRLPNLRPAAPEAALTWKTGLLTIGPTALPVIW
jgi:cytochrome P450